MKDNMLMVASEMTVAGKKGTTRLSYARVTTIAGDSFMSMAQAAACISSTTTIASNNSNKQGRQKKKKGRGEEEKG